MNSIGERAPHRVGVTPYPAYRDSGVAWLGKVPAHWEVRRLKTLVNDIADAADPSENDGIQVAMEHVEGWTGRIRTSASDAESSFDQGKRFIAGDILFGGLHANRCGVSGIGRSARQ